MTELQPFTGVDHGNVSPLFHAWVPDSTGTLRPPLVQEALKLSYDLALTSYSMDASSWIRAGWQDVTVMLEGTVTRGPDQGGKITPPGRMENGVRRFYIRQKLRTGSPVAQVRGARRQRKSSRTARAIVMCRPDGLGHYVIAIGFMGTGKRLYDWYSNFRMHPEEHMHQGFLQLTKQFESRESRISFPKTAAELGMTSLSLRDILKECTRPGSRFLIWMAGHSQGGTLLQIYTWRKVMLNGVRPECMLGYGFASPTAADGFLTETPSAWPLYHVLNRDDVVPRMGARVHLGVVLTYPSDQKLRREAYTWPRDQKSVQARIAVRPMLALMKDTPGFLFAVTALLKASENLSPTDLQEMMHHLHRSGWQTNPHLLKAADNGVDVLIDRLIRIFIESYEAIMGVPMDQVRLKVLTSDIRAKMDQIGPMEYLLAVSQLAGEAHAFRNRRNGTHGAYRWITENGFSDLIPSVWTYGADPKRVSISIPVVKKEYI